MVDAAGSPTLRCVVVTPEETVLDTEVEFLALPLYDGELGVARGHAPMIGRLGCGELRVRQQGQVRRFYIDGGFVQVVDNVASILTNRAVPAGELNASQLEQTLSDKIAQPAAGEEELLRRQMMIDQSRAQLRIARKN